MRILVFGASGAVGSRVVQEAVARGHQVTGASRTPTAAHLRRGDATDPDDVAVLSRDHDVVISATRPRPGQEDELVQAAKGLLIGLRHSGVRLILVGGAAGLIDGRTGLTVMESPDFPPDWRPIAQACNEQLELVRAATDVHWTYVSPPALLEPGTRTGSYRLGTDHLVTDAAGGSSISMEDFAIALVDEAEQARHVGARFTVGH
ncbi:NAD(P)-dependent oxidoreductase [Kribbella sp. NPDC002412]